MSVEKPWDDSMLKYFKDCDVECPERDMFKQAHKRSFHVHLSSKTPVFNGAGLIEMLGSDERRSGKDFEIQLLSLACMSWRCFTADGSDVCLDVFLDKKDVKKSIVNGGIERMESNHLMNTAFAQGDRVTMHTDVFPVGRDNQSKKFWRHNTISKRHDLMIAMPHLRMDLIYKSIQKVIDGDEDPVVRIYGHTSFGKAITFLQTHFPQNVSSEDRLMMVGGQFYECNERIKDRWVDTMHDIVETMDNTVHVNNMLMEAYVRQPLPTKPVPIGIYEKPVTTGNVVLEEEPPQFRLSLEMVAVYTL